LDGWIKQFELEDTIKNNFSDKILKNFERTTNLVTEMIDYCLKNNFRPVLVTTPVSEILNNRMSNEFIQSFLCNNIKKANIQNVPFLDYLHDNLFKIINYI